MRIGIAQIDTVPGAFDETVERMVVQSRRAAEQGVELIVFPLAALAGVDLVPFSDRPSFMRDLADAVASLAERLACPALVPVPVDAGDRDGHFDVLLLDNGELRALRAPSGPRGNASEGSEDQELPVFSFGGLRFALALSHEDLDVLDDYDYDIDAAVFVSCYPFAVDEPSSVMGADLTNGRFAADAQTMGAWLVGAAPVGGYGDLVFTGASFVLSPTGELVASAPSFEEALLVADVAGNPTEPRGASLGQEVFDLPFHLWETVVLGMRDYVDKHGYTDVVLCLDGTLGSQVLAALASDALGPTHVHVLVGSSAGQSAPVCRELARRLRVDQVDGLGQLKGFDERDFDELQLAALAREHGALVLSSLDKTALALGVETARLSAATLCPLGDVYRSDVLDMAHIRNTISPLFRRVGLGPQDELLLPMPDGTVRRIADEQELTAVDEVLLGYVEYDRPLCELVVEGGTPLELVDAVLRAERASELARRCVPPVLAMSTHTLDDARFPLGVRWHDEHAERLPELSGDVPIPSGVTETADGGEAQGPSAREVPSLEDTLSMLRDLAEQAGFDLSRLELAGPSSLHDDGLAGQGPEGKPAWMTPFSEN